MATTSRSSFLDRVAAAVRAGNKYREAESSQLAPGVGYVGAGDDRVQRLVEELTRVGAFPVRTGSHEELCGSVRALISRHSIRTALLNDSRLVTELNIASVLRDAAVDVFTIGRLAEMDEPMRQDALFAADLGIASPDWVIAETGSLVYAACASQTRSATLLPPVHLAIVDSASIIPDLFDLPEYARARARDGVLPRNVTLVTGPSKTGDIELKLTTGVHGPGEVHVLIWDRKTSSP